MRFGNVEVRPAAGRMGCLVMLLISVVVSVVLTILLRTWSPHVKSRFTTCRLLTQPKVDCTAPPDRKIAAPQCLRRRFHKVSSRSTTAPPCRTFGCEAQCSSAAWTQTVLPPGCRSAPHCSPLPSTIARPRPEAASAGARQGCGMRVLLSLTSTRTQRVSASTRTVNSVRACSTALVTSSFAAVTRVWTRSSPTDPAGIPARDRRRKRRARETASGWGRNRSAPRSSAGTS